MIDTVHATQATFRVLLDALARPGVPRALPAWRFGDAPAALGPALAAAALALLDGDVALWEQPGGLDAPARAWLTFHTGTRLCFDGTEADFALIRDLSSLELGSFAVGTPEEPEHSTTLLIRLPRLDGGLRVSVRGPGIEEVATCAPPVPRGFWEAWRRNGSLYPCGVDAFLFDDTGVIGLPRTLLVEEVRG